MVVCVCVYATVMLKGEPGISSAPHRTVNVWSPFSFVLYPTCNITFKSLCLVLSRKFLTYGPLILHHIEIHENSNWCSNLQFFSFSNLLKIERID